MTFTEETALALARRAHEGQLDKAGRPYIEHPERVMARLGGPCERMAAALHDVLEDTDVTADVLRDAGCPEPVIAAVDALTKRPGEPLADSMRRAAADPIAYQVKLADIADNSDPVRLSLLDNATAGRLRDKYAESTRLLTALHERGRPAATLRFREVELRRWRGNDLDELYHVVEEARDHLLPWMPFAATHSRAQDEEFLAQCRTDWEADKAYTYAITSGGAMIGSCGLARRIGPGGLEIGYWLHPAWTGRGLVTMAASALVEAARGLPDVDHVEIHHDEANHASGAVPRRLGFTEVERVRLPDGPATPGATGIQVIWRLAIPEGR